MFQYLLEYVDRHYEYFDLKNMKSVNVAMTLILDQMKSKKKSKERGFKTGCSSETWNE